MLYKIYTIYVIENLITNKKYIGFTSGNLQTRFEAHIRDALNENTNQIIHRSLRKYGKENFKIYAIYQSKDKNHCYEEMERYFIEEYNTHHIDGNGYNMTYGGDGLYGYIWSDDQRKNKSISQIGENNHMYGKIPWNKGIKMWPDGRPAHSDDVIEKLKSSLKEYYKENSGSIKGKKAITDGKITRYIFENEELPDGFWYGRTFSKK
jgi:hypothetical protein